MFSYMSNAMTFHVPIEPVRDASGCVYFMGAFTVPIEPLAWRAPNGTVYFSPGAQDHAKYEHAAEVAQRAAAAQHAAEVAQRAAAAAQRERAEADAAERAAAAAQRERAEAAAERAAEAAQRERAEAAAERAAESERAAAAAKRATERSVAKRALYIASARKAALAVHASARQQQQQRKTTQMPFVRPARPLHRKPLLYPETRLRGADRPEVLARARAHAEVCREDLAARRRAAKLLAEQQQQQQQQQQEQVDEQLPTKAASSAVSAQDAEHERVVTARQRRLEAAQGLFYPQWRHRLQWAAVGAAQAERQSAQLRDSDGGRESSVDASSERSLLHTTDASRTSSPTASVAGSDPQQLPFPTHLADVEDFDPARDEQQPQRAPSPFAPVPASSSPASSSPAASATPGHLTPTQASLVRAVSRSASRGAGSACKPGRSLSPDAPAACHSARVLRDRRAAACARETEAAEERARAQRRAKNNKLVARATQRAVERGAPAPGLLSPTISSTGKVHL